MGAGRRGVFNDLSENKQKMKLIESWEKLFQSNQRGHLSKVEKFQDNPETPPDCLNSSTKAVAERDSEPWLQNPDVDGHLES